MKTIIPQKNRQSFIYGKKSSVSKFYFLLNFLNYNSFINSIKIKIKKNKEQLTYQKRFENYKYYTIVTVFFKEKLSQILFHAKKNLSKKLQSADPLFKAFV